MVHRRDDVSDLGRGDMTMYLSCGRWHGAGDMRTVAVAIEEIGVKVLDDLPSHPYGKSTVPSGRRRAIILFLKMFNHGVSI